MRSSMSHEGNCWDNAAAESFWRRLKAAIVHSYKFPPVCRPSRRCWTGWLSTVTTDCTRRWATSAPWCASNAAPRVRKVAAPTDFKEWGATTGRRDGSLRTSFQEQGAGQAAATEHGLFGGNFCGGGRVRGHPGAVAV
jgi:hypothetical protein